jgi:anthranilate/para-aminobenzoate synthase component II
MIWILVLVSTMERERGLDPNRVLVAQQAQAMEVRAQHREIERVQPESRLTPEEEKLHARFVTFWLR